MDTRTGNVVFFEDEAERRRAEANWRAWQAGVLKDRPRFIPIEADQVPTTKKRRRRKKGRRSYRDFCN